MTLFLGQPFEMEMLRKRINLGFFDARFVVALNESLSEFEGKILDEALVERINMKIASMAKIYKEFI